jgi:NAD-dependent deacetylase
MVPTQVGLTLRLKTDTTDQAPQTKNMADLKQISDWLASAERTVVFTGAGISTESGIPDFRSPGGIWSKTQPVYFDDFMASADSRHEYWRQKASGRQEFAAATPNSGHQILAQWEAAGRVRAVITQNIDGLHQDAGSKKVLELHGTARFVACLDCGVRYEVGEMVDRFLATDEPPCCEKCDGLTKHATISFGQSLDPEVLEEASRLSAEADLFLAMGSSLVVQPAAGMPALACQSGSRLVIINREPTPLDSSAAAVIHAPLGETLEAIDRLIADGR